MACTHSDSCPLHPHLNNSLRAWRDHYCDDDTRWHDCARYQRSLAGKPIPLPLLPNGKMVGLGIGPDAGVATATTTDPTPTSPLGAEAKTETSTAPPTSTTSTPGSGMARSGEVDGAGRGSVAVLREVRSAAEAHKAAEDLARPDGADAIERRSLWQRLRSLFGTSA